jgi:hypothetical protein
MILHMVTYRRNIQLLLIYLFIEFEEQHGDRAKPVFPFPFDE